MKLQLTKDKTIDVRLPFGGGGTVPSDVVGIELGADDPRGCPAVRLVRRKGRIQVYAAGFVKPPEGHLPGSWEELGKQSAWSLPVDFQAPSAAIAASSKDMFLRQTTPDMLTADAKAAPKPAAENGRRKLMLKTAKPVVEAQPAEKTEDKPAEPVVPGVPVSHNGMRFAVQPMSDETFVVESGMPEYQVLWLSRLLPEGRRPTAVSVQTLPSALLSSVLRQPAFLEENGNAFVVFVTRGSVFFAGFREGRLLLLRECPGAHGWVAVREAVKAGLGLDDSMVDEVLNDQLIDPTSVMELFVRPMLQQLEISLDYLARRHSLNISRALLLGLPSGALYWSKMAMDALRIPLVAPGAFEGLEPPARGERFAPQDDMQSQLFVGALGAALAAMEVKE